MRQFQTLVAQLQYGIFCLLLFTLPYGEIVTRPLWVLWLILWAAEGRWLVRPTFRRGMMALMAGLILFFGWQAVSALWAIDPSQPGLLLGRQVSLLAIGVISCWGLNEYYRPDVLLKVLIAGAVISVGHFLYTHFWVVNWELAWDKHWPVPPHADPLWTMHNLTLDFRHHTYYGSILIFALMSLVYLLPGEVARYGRLRAYFCGTLVAMVLLLGIYWSGGRQILLTLMLIGVVCGLVLLFSGRLRWRYRLMAVALALALCAGGVFSFMNRQSHEQNSEPRMALWQAASEHVDDYAAYGVGAGCNQAQMLRYFEQYGWENFAARGFNCHNQYLCSLMELGCGGLLLFVVLFFSVPFAFSGRERICAMMVCSVFWLNCLTENYLTRIEGIIQLGVALLLLMLLPRYASSRD